MKKELENIINKEFPQKCGDSLLVLEKTNIKRGTNSFYRCQFQKYFYEILAPKVRILEGSVNNPQIEIEEFVKKEWPQNCGDILKILEKVDNGKWKCQFLKYPYEIKASKRDIIRGKVNNPQIEIEEFVKKEWPQNCGDTLKIIEKDELSGLWKCQFLKYPYCNYLFFRKDRIKEGSCLNPQLEINLIGKIFHQNCGDDLKILERIDKGWKCEFINYPYKIVVRNQKYFINGNVVNPLIEQNEFIDKIWHQNCGDDLKIIKKSNKQQDGEFLWECEFIKYPNKVLALKYVILLGQVINEKLPHLSKEGLEFFIKNNFSDKPTYEEVIKKYSIISRSHFNHQILKFGLKNLILYPSQSSLEKEIREYCLTLNNSTCLEGNWKILDGQEIDIYIPNKKLGIEFNGNFWHSDNSKCGRDCYYHQDKSLLAEQKGIFLFHIFEFEWENKQEIIKSLIKFKLGIFDKKIGASKCKIKELDYKTYAVFCNENHLQGECGAKVKLGLFYKDELIQIMSFGSPRFTDKYEWEIIRECSKKEYLVLGGKEKLWKYFIKKYNPKNCISYCDYSKFNGHSYLKLGFKKERLNKPGFWWYDNKSNSVLPRTPSKNNEYKEKYYKIYDAGQLVFSWSKKN